MYIYFVLLLFEACIFPPFFLRTATSKTRCDETHRKTPEKTYQMQLANHGSTLWRKRRCPWNPGRLPKSRVICVVKFEVICLAVLSRWWLDLGCTQVQLLVSLRVKIEMRFVKEHNIHMSTDEWRSDILLNCFLKVYKSKSAIWFLSKTLCFNKSLVSMGRRSFKNWS